MRNNWDRATATVDLGQKELEALIYPAFPNAAIEKISLTEGGLANTNIRVKIVADPDSYLIRVYTSDPQQAEKEFALNKLVERTVPSPHFIHFSKTNSVTGHPYAIMQFVNGQRLESVFSQLSEPELSEVGKNVGSVLAAIHAFKFPSAGFFDGQLAVVTPIDLGGSGLINFVARHMGSGIARERAGKGLADKLLYFVESEALLLDRWTGKPCLTHADFGGSNILVANNSNRWEVSAVLDWEFAFSGSPFFDFGNLLREPVESMQPFVDDLTASYLFNGGLLPPEWRKMSLLTDLTAWVDFLTRPTINQALVDDAQRVINSTIDKWQS